MTIYHQLSTEQVWFLGNGRQTYVYQNSLPALLLGWKPLKPEI